MKAAIIDPPFDPFSNIPWEIIFDDAGRVIGEVYLLDMPGRLFMNKRRKPGWKK